MPKSRRIPNTAFGKKVADPDLLLRLVGKPTGDELRQQQLEAEREVNRQLLAGARAARDAKRQAAAEQRSLERLQRQYGIDQPEGRADPCSPA